MKKDILPEQGMKSRISTLEINQYLNKTAAFMHNKLICYAEKNVVNVIKKIVFDRTDLLKKRIDYLNEEIEQQNKRIEQLSLSPVWEVSLPTDDEILNYWKRKNCFGQYLEGLVDGSKDMRDRMRSQALSSTEWVSVEERLPERYVSVFAWGPGKGINVAVLIDNIGPRNIGYTHWMPLPNPPKQ